MYPVPIFIGEGGGGTSWWIELAMFLFAMGVGLVSLGFFIGGTASAIYDAKKPDKVFAGIGAGFLLLFFGIPWLICCFGLALSAWRSMWGK